MIELEPHHGLLPWQEANHQIFNAVIAIALLELGGGSIEALSSGDRWILPCPFCPFVFLFVFWKIDQPILEHPAESASQRTAAKLSAYIPFLLSTVYATFQNLCISWHPVVKAVLLIYFRILQSN